jgi:hypothetical protein
MYTELPLIETSTPVERIAALRTAKELLTATPGESKPAIFGGGSVETVYAPDTEEMLRLAEYITTGHDYRDTHPEGKRRPVIKKITNVTVVAPEGVAPSQEDIEHLLGHITDGSFAQFIEDAMRQEQDKEQGKEEGAGEEPDDRPRFGGSASDFK